MKLNFVRTLHNFNQPVFSTEAICPLINFFERSKTLQAFNVKLKQVVLTGVVAPWEATRQSKAKENDD